MCFFKSRRSAEAEGDRESGLHAASHGPRPCAAAPWTLASQLQLYGRKVRHAGSSGWLSSVGNNRRINLFVVFLLPNAKNRKRAAGARVHPPLGRLVLTCDGFCSRHRSLLSEGMKSGKRRVVELLIFKWSDFKLNE
ncbi:hypothetical protein EYF80_062085 [Liparis tanakae]|uniref:Uncharacterized protein n=1 Tax=Liparis tanakae TaxID=230148 RepID=A0A4Z2EFP8_9TELE|nr:hypothetical protein EYF80_062085 [Liparis tanakae]